MDFKIRIYLCFLLFTFVKCIIPNLSVKKIDSKLIERKRQDTLEICRIFNEENKRGLSASDPNSAIIKEDNTNNRNKRNVDNNDLGNTILKEEDLARVEKIVDKLYDELDSTTVAYRRRVLNDASKKNSTININRRYNFAPVQLKGPLENKNEQEKILSQPHLIKIPWIKKWTDGIVPFFIDSKSYDSFLVEIILKAFDYIEKTTCIRLQRLRERPTDKKSMQNVEWLYITNPSGIRQCVHTNERNPNSGVQMVVFGYDCLSQGEIAHEIMHVLGFSHEHTRPDRDRYITILWENIKPGYKKYFDMGKENYLSNLPYDYNSVLHYPPRSFSKNGQVTIVTESGKKIGQRDAFSELDVEKIRMIYGEACVQRNINYLNKTCKSASEADYIETKTVTEDEIKQYFKDRIWPYGYVNFMFKDVTEFTAEERENIKAVMNHIKKETCVMFYMHRNIEVTDSNELEDEFDNDFNESLPAQKLIHVTEKVPLAEANSENENMDLPGDDNNESPIGQKLIHVTEKVPLVEANSENENMNLSDDDDNESSIWRKPVHVTENVAFADNEDETNKPKPKSRNKSISDTRRHGKAKNVAQLKSNQKKSKEKDIKLNVKKVRIPLPRSSLRRHAENLLVLKRSTEPGCKCPPPGRPNGRKILSISTDCFNSVHDLLHLFVHILGLDHQHNMYDRDKYLYINWDNMSPEIKKEMQKTLPPAATVGFAYDYQSVMHYPWMQIKDGVMNTMYPVWNDGWTMGNWQGLSWTDVQKINRIYKEVCDQPRPRGSFKFM